MAARDNPSECGGVGSLYDYEGSDPSTQIAVHEIQRPINLKTKEALPPKRTEIYDHDFEQ